MLIRAYRVSDKLGIVFLKSIAAVGDHALTGGSAITGMFASVLRMLWRILYALISGVVGIARRLLNLVLLIASPVVRGITRVGQRGAQRALRTSQKTVAASSSAATGTMARRAARAEIKEMIAEDPLRVQNRLLSRLVVVLGVVVIGVLLWATSGIAGQRSAVPIVAPDTGIEDAAVSGVGDTQPDQSSGAAPVPTAIPTATDLPSALAVRGSLAYTVRENGQTDIWAVGIGQRTALRVTNSPEDDRDPAWSPDGARLAYASRQDGNWEIYILDVTTMETFRLTYDQSFQASPGWSPDGQWIIYESYQGNNLDVYIVRSDASEAPIRLTSHPAPDYSPVWSPDGRRIAFVSWRDGNQDLYVINLDNPTDDAAVNITNTPTRFEEHPAWSPDAGLVTFSAIDEGREKVFVKSANDPAAAAQALSFGRAPVWSPDGGSLAFAVDSLEGTQLVAEPFAGVGTLTEIIPVPRGATDPSWTNVPLPLPLINSGGLNNTTQALYVEQFETYQRGAPFRLNNLIGVDVPPPSNPLLNDRVNDSFNALRERTLQVAGWDFLAQLDDAFWALDRRPALGEPRRNWHMTGRAFSITRNAIRGFPPLIEIVRYDLGVDTYWRVYVRVDEDAQFGQLGEPLRQMPWDFAARDSGDVEAYNQGGRLRTEMPSGYYIDFTLLASDYGWEWMPAGADWRGNFAVTNYWMFRKPETLDWLDAMLEIYVESELGGFAPTPTAAPALATPTDTTEGGG